MTGGPVKLADYHNQQDAFHSNSELSKCLVTCIRQLYGMTQKDLAAVVGMHPQSLAKIERGRASVSDDLHDKLLILRDIAHLPGVTALVKHLAQRGDHLAAFNVAYNIQRAAM